MTTHVLLPPLLMSGPVAARCGGVGAVGMNVNDTAMSLTTDRNDPDLHKKGTDGQNEKYLILSNEERAKGFIRPVRTKYKHLKCGSVTTMGLALSETYARQPSFYSTTFCCTCGAHFPVGENGEFTWDSDDTKVGT